MFRRTFTLLLVFLMLANQGLCLAHVHRGKGFAEPEDHGSRPHFHVGGHHHDHGHHHHADHSHSHQAHNAPDSDEHDATFPSAFSPVDHDSDAVYCGEPVTIARGGKSAHVLPEKDVAGPAVLQIANQIDGLQCVGRSRGQPPSVFDTACPIFLRTLSLRL